MNDISVKFFSRNDNLESLNLEDLGNFKIDHLIYNCCNYKIVKIIIFKNNLNNLKTKIKKRNSLVVFY